MMIGVPRKKSVYTIARARSGFAPGPGSPRTMAIASANTRTRTSAITIMWRFTWKPAHTSGNASVKLCGLKNAWATWCSACMSLVQGRDRREVEVEPLLLELGDRAVGGELLHHRVDRHRQLRALLEHRPVLLVRGDLSGHRAEPARVLLLLQRDERHVEDQRL